MIKIRDDEFLKQFGLHVRKLREKRDMTQYKLAQAANISRSQVLAIEGGKINTSVSTCKALAEALDISLSELFAFS